MGRPITQEDLDIIKTLNIKNIIKFYKYTFIIISIGYIYIIYIYDV